MKKTAKTKPPKPAKKPSQTGVKARVKKPVSKPASQANDDDLYDQGDIATPRRDPPYEDGL
ncbi:MAG TPA: hypothetical protein DCZ49_02020 [Hyphomonadaceae bacterium]|nr:hypothetical protein [Hyphomonadaceae bacterium]